MAVVQIDDKAEESARRRSELRFPSNTLADSVFVAKTINDRGGGRATAPELAAFLNYAGTNNGAFLSRIGAARLFCLVSREGDRFSPTPLAQNILMPVYDWTPKEALVEAFFNVELFRKVYDEYNGKQLPPEFGLKNALKTMFGVAPNRVERAFRVLMESAETAGLFETRAGARTHLIIPTINKGQAVGVTRDTSAGRAAFGGGGSGAGSGSGAGVGGSQDGGDAGDASNFEGADYERAPGNGERSNKLSSIEIVKAKYLESLIRLFEEKSKEGELDDGLMTRIERLLGYENKTVKERPDSALTLPGLDFAAPPPNPR